MKTRSTAIILTILLVWSWAHDAAAQTAADRQPAPELRDDIAGINRSLARLVDLLETIRDNQKVDLLLKRIELKERRLAPLESRLRDAESRCEGIQTEIDEMTTMRARVEEEIDEAVRTGRDETSRDEETMLKEIDVRLEMLRASLERAIAQKREREDELAAQSEEIEVLDEMLEDLLE